MLYKRFMVLADRGHTNTHTQSKYCNPRACMHRALIIPKKAEGKWRLIVDLPSPLKHSVNDGIAGDLASLEYITVDRGKVLCWLKLI